MDDLTKAINSSTVSVFCAAQARQNTSATARDRRLISFLARRVFGVPGIFAVDLGRGRHLFGLLVGQRIRRDVVLDFGLCRILPVEAKLGFVARQDAVGAHIGLRLVRQQKLVAADVLVVVIQGG